MENKEKKIKVQKAINTLIDFCVIDNAIKLNRLHGVGVDCTKCPLNIKNPKYDKTKEISDDNLPEICKINDPIDWYAARKKTHKIFKKNEKKLIREKTENKNNLLSI